MTYACVTAVTALFLTEFPQNYPQLIQLRVAQERCPTENVETTLKIRSFGPFHCQKKELLLITKPQMDKISYLSYSLIYTIRFKCRCFCIHCR